MTQYCVNVHAQANGDHEVHSISDARDCLPAPANRQDLGSHLSCESAVRKASGYFARVNGCAVCAPICHTS